MRDIPFRETLTARQIKANSLVCVGLDPLVERLPQSIEKDFPPTERFQVLMWMTKIGNATAEYASMFKMNRAHWEAIDRGVDILGMLISEMNMRHPDIPVFVDCKRGDIDRTQRQYREAHFTRDGADGINYNGYLGADALKDLVDPAHPGRALVGLGRTSNPNAWHVQDRLLADGRQVWEAMVEDILAWSEDYGVLENAGVVMGAAHTDPRDPSKVFSSHLVRAREIVGDRMWLLIPGIGSQKEFVEETIRATYAGPGSIAINSSSGIIFASSGPDFAEAAGREAKKLRDLINQYR